MNMFRGDTITLPEQDKNRTGESKRDSSVRHMGVNLTIDELRYILGTADWEKRDIRSPWEITESVTA